MENLYEILKNAPKGLKLYSPVIGEVDFTSVYEREDRRIIEVSRHDKRLAMELDEFGRLLGAEAECILFPSAKYKSWKGWQQELVSKFTDGVLFITSAGGLIWVCGDKITSINTNSGSIYNISSSWVYWGGLNFASHEDYIKFHHILDSKRYVCEQGQIKAIDNIPFKDGDILYDEASNAILIFSHVSAGNIMDYASYFPKHKNLFHHDQDDDCGFYGSVDYCKLRMATPDEVKFLLQKLVENDICWDAKNKKLISLKDVDFTTWLHHQPGYGICPPPMSEEQFERFLNMYLFDKPYISSVSLSDAQYRTELLDAILTKHSKKYRKERK